MRPVSMVWVLAAAMLSALSAASPAQAATVANGGFEVPDLGDNPRFRFRSADSVPGWDSSARDIEIWANGFSRVTSYEGTQHVELNARGAGTLFQDVAGIAEGSSLTFEFAHRARRGTDVLRFALTDLGGDGGPGGGDDTTLFSDEFSASTAGWVLNTGSTFSPVTALGGTVRLSFTAVSTGSGSASVGNFLDAVSLTAEAPPAVPLPAGVPLLVSGLAALALLRRRRARG
ncbi:VPLPA-CTERM sorting domain-containing protein [Rhodovulum sp. 12E13]|uniref:VPLPA-CTERM sorting domain-containing protein n=1 Tax=Rhodovulum sp. 12E13 TaxID=2203891 RepID=UPI000E1A3F84|nr:VPLPA-CTERM sorting domain-containing protein [Rhodovulum sp. 12E13]RDC71343.1 VPLPA-CTERM sorting domain-containing protein [Rhodovulum sp. 12E13]